MRDGWQTVTLREVLTLEYGKALKEADRDGGRYPVYGSAGPVGSHSKHLGPDGPMIVVGRKGTAGSVWWSDDPGWPIDTAYWVKLQTEGAELAFVYLLLQNLDLAAISAQTGVPGLNRDRAYEIAVGLPPIDEQRRIVDIIDALDATLQECAAEMGATTALAEAVRVDAFGDPDEGVRLLGSLCADGGIQIGPFGSQVHAHDYVPDGVPMVMPRDIVDRRISTEKIARITAEHAGRLERHRLEIGDIVIPRRGDLTKRALVGPREEGWLCGTGSARIRLASVDPAAVFHALSVPAVDQWLSENAVGATMPNLNTDIISRIPVKLPDTADLVVSALESIQIVADALKELHQSLEVARVRLLSDLLSGDQEMPDPYGEFLVSA